MNYINKLTSLAVLVTALSSCDFNEDFCIRNGELVAWCDFSGITDTPPVAQDRHVLAFGTDVPHGEGMTFTQDTLRWSLPQGNYRFLFYTGNYDVGDAGDYYEARLIADTDTIEGEVYISEVQGFCCSAGFNERLEYQKSRRVEIRPTAFVQKLNIRINVSGNTGPLKGLYGTLSGISTARYLVSRERTGNAEVAFTFACKEEDRWDAGVYAFGFNPSADNNLTVKVEMEEEDAVFNEQRTIDLTPYLRGFDDDELSLELNLHIGKELTIDEPVVIPEWEDTPETDLSNL